MFSNLLRQRYLVAAVRVPAFSGRQLSGWAHVSSVNAASSQAKTAPAPRVKSVEEEAQETWELLANNAKDLFTTHPPHNTYSGRSVVVPAKAGGFTEALYKLNTILSRNNVRAEKKRSMRHEKSGVKRRRLRSELWRKIFAQTVRQKVQLVNCIRRRGA